MFYPPNTIVGCHDAFYLVDKNGSWVKFAELGRKGWKILRFTQELLNHALDQIRKIREEEAAAKAEAQEAVVDGEVKVIEPVKVIEVTGTEVEDVA